MGVVEGSVDLGQQNEAVWSRTARTYADAAEKMTGQVVDPLLDAAAVGRGTRLLDVGTGPGTVIGPARRRGAQVVAVDVVEAMVEAARARHPDADVRVADAVDLPFSDETFDAVSMAFAVLVLPDPLRALAEARRVLKPAGRIALTTWAAIGLEAMAVGGAAIADLGIQGPDWSSAPMFGVAPDVLVDALVEAGFEQPYARQLDVVIPYRDAEPLVEHFASVFDVDAQGPSMRTRLAEHIEAALSGRRDADGTAWLPNPAVLAAGRAPGRG